jgi:hypothetical protein
VDQLSVDCGPNADSNAAGRLKSYRADIFGETGASIGAKSVLFSK